MRWIEFTEAQFEQASTQQPAVQLSVSPLLVCGLPDTDSPNITEAGSSLQRRTRLRMCTPPCLLCRAPYTSQLVCWSPSSVFRDQPSRVLAAIMSPISPSPTRLTHS